MLTAFRAKPVAGICGNCTNWLENFSGRLAYGTCKIDGDLHQFHHRCNVPD